MPRLPKTIRVPIRVSQKGWYYFRVGQTYSGFPLGFLGNMVAIYELVLKQLPFFAALHFSGFLLTGGLAWVAITVYAGILHMKFQVYVDSEVASPPNKYNYEMFPYGVQAFMGMQMGRMQTEYGIEFNRLNRKMWEVFHKIAPDIVTAEELEGVKSLFDTYIKEMEKYLAMYEVLMRGGSLGKGKVYDFNRSDEYQSPYKDE